ncbi:FxsC protein [Actinacidiphila guanduensis]|uniref:FxsC C-terminal domain-containing protein n=1 Tax=Actinacidiphila guanduensis TaxID=310781 RepID=A0A1H0E0W1_9ACTN|nr:FxsC protein [Actinacidiphila guanduensis]SDN76032.1 FxsC C-terminal domain-containing protein [Actinacidiphila guanduensis]
MSRFYLSHIRGVDEEWTAAFVRDLSAAVAARTGEAADRIAVRADPHVPGAAVEQMAAATTMVVLHAPGYFGQSYCAAEWTYFQQRAQVLWSRTGRTADAIIPVVWEPTGQPLPAAVRRQAPLAVDSAAYARDGVLHLLRLKARYAEDYRRVVAALADRVAATHGRPLPEVPGFDAGSSGSFSFPVLPAEPGEGQRAVRFVMAAAAADDLPAERTATEFYGRSPTDWTPYAPGQPGVLAALLRDTAAALDFAPTVLALDEETVGRVRSGARAEELLVLLVDAWAAGLREKRALLESLDAEVADTVAVLEPRNRDDPQTTAHAPELDGFLDRALPSLRRHATELERWGLPDVEKFTTALRKALIRAQNDAIKSSQAGRRLPTPPGGLDSFPLLGRSFS